MSGSAQKRCVTLTELAERLRSTDLVPSQRLLLDHTDERLARLAAADITSVADILTQLKYSKSVPSVAASTEVDEDYLILLRRAVRGFYPEPTPLRSFDWIGPEHLAALAGAGIKNSEQLRAACRTGSAEVVERSGVPSATISELVELSDLVRVQWISPSLARTLRVAGYRTPAAVAGADPDRLVQEVAAANQDRRYFNASIGLRDMRRIIDAAAYAT